MDKHRRQSHPEGSHASERDRALREQLSTGLVKRRPREAYPSLACHFECVGKPRPRDFRQLSVDPFEAVQHMLAVTGGERSLKRQVCPCRRGHLACERECAALEIPKRKRLDRGRFAVEPHIAELLWVPEAASSVRPTGPVRRAPLLVFDGPVPAEVHSPFFTVARRADPKAREGDAQLDFPRAADQPLAGGHVVAESPVSVPCQRLVRAAVVDAAGWVAQEVEPSFARRLEPDLDEIGLGGQIAIACLAAHAQDTFIARAEGKIQPAFVKSCIRNRLPLGECAAEVDKCCHRRRAVPFSPREPAIECRGLGQLRHSEQRAPPRLDVTDRVLLRRAGRAEKNIVHAHLASHVDRRGELRHLAWFLRALERNVHLRLVVAPLI